VKSPRRQRLDTLLVEKGLVESREKARALILRVAGPDPLWVSRVGIKLAKALETFGIDAPDRVAFDVGASTGGFTDVWLQRGARHVIALDVGHSQLHWKVRSDPRVTVIENTNARHLQPGDLPDAGAITRVSIDVSFISLKHIFPVLPALVARPTEIVALVKPQFEAGRKDVGKGGLVTDPAVHARVVAEVSAAAAEVGLERLGLIESPSHLPALATEVCCEDELVLICQPVHRFAKAAAVKAQDLAGEPFVSRELGSGTREFMDQYLRSCDVAPEDLNMVMELGSPEAIKGVVETGLGVSIVSHATRCALRNSRHASMTGCTTMPHGYGL
jgi:23S rRNA (cytidine1920-2'-O)/16S rRNA (cytidine1409-2'-O)-methyltransferase